MQSMKDIDDLKNMGCQCKDVDFGIYEAAVWVINPFTNRKTTIDVCVLAEVVYLWNQDIETVESCCGHNQTHGYIAVTDESIKVMKEIGYIAFKSNCFYRRGNWWLNN